MAGYGNYVYGGGAYGGVVAWSGEDPVVSRTWADVGVGTIDVWAVETVTNIETWVSIL